MKIKINQETDWGHVVRVILQTGAQLMETPVDWVSGKATVDTDGGIITEVQDPETGRFTLGLLGVSQAMIKGLGFVVEGGSLRIIFPPSFLTMPIRRNELRVSECVESGGGWRIGLLN